MSARKTTRSMEGTMIRQTNNDMLPRLFERGSKAEPGLKPGADKGGAASSFADDLLRAQSDRAGKEKRAMAPEVVDSGRDAPKRGESNAPGMRDPNETRDTREKPSAERAGESKRKAKKGGNDEAENLRSQTGAGSESRQSLERTEKPVDKSVDKSSDVQEENATVATAANGNASSTLRSMSDKVEAKPVAGKAVEGESTKAMGAVNPAIASGASAETARMLAEFGQEQALVKHEAMTEFMAKMQTELGVAPESILEAFGEMDAEALLAPPEESMQQFLKNLDLPAGQMPRAQELYGEMIEATGEAELNEKLAGLGDGVDLEVLSPRDRALRDLNKSIDQLNNAFAAPKAKATMSAEQMNAELVRLSQMKQGADKVLNGKDTDDVLGASFFGASAEAGARTSALDSSATPATGLSPVVANSMTMNAQSSNGGSSSSGWSSSGKGSSNASAQGDLAKALKEASEGTKGSAKEFSSALGAESAPAVGADSLATTPAAPGMPMAPGATAAATGPAGMIIDGPKPTQQDESENVRELIKQAQFMVKKGGGEMKLEMSPEGMGKVHLKVAVENGQVNVQMLTDNDATKKMLEDGIHELKASLAAHKLHVDTMKIDVGGEIQKQMDQNAQQDANREQSRQFARDFMEQFRDERGSFRQGFAESGGGLRSYGRGMNRPSMEPEPVVSATRAKADSSRRLNLVA